MQAANRRYGNCRICSEQQVTFEEEEITLDIAQKGVVLSGGWKVFPYSYPGVSPLPPIFLLSRLRLCMNCVNFHRSEGAMLMHLILVNKCPPASCMLHGIVQMNLQQNWSTLYIYWEQKYLITGSDFLHCKQHKVSIAKSNVIAYKIIGSFYEAVLHVM